MTLSQDAGWYLSTGAVFAIVMTWFARLAEKQGQAEGTDTLHDAPFLWFLAWTALWPWMILRTDAWIEIRFQENAEDKPKPEEEEDAP